ncbi:hypothetical protein [Nocardia pseudovaccinii]|uniref:hypothetical protein n=1 Tax=Nocardia pseudovaccinii TaxID=189540 RepID=UPI0007A41DBB|nr:hypothetical protein [Nocardia pseudovaccinii]
MANVYVDEMKCVDESGSGIDEWGSDDVYLLLFRGRIPTGAAVQSSTEFTVTGPGGFWDVMDDGDRRSRDVLVATFDPASLYVVQLIEKDDGRDVAGDVTGAYRTGLNLAWTAALARTIGQSASQRRPVLAQAISDSLRALNEVFMELPKGNDDEIGRPQALPTKQPAVLEFKGASGLYRTTFKVV